MITLNIPAFHLGIEEELEKQAFIGLPAYEGIHYDRETKSYQPSPSPGIIPHIKRNLGKYTSLPVAAIGVTGAVAGGAAPLALGLTGAKVLLALGLGINNDRRDAELALYQENEKIKNNKRNRKQAAFDVTSMPSNENILPNISSQAKWKYVRTKDGLRLSDGNHVYSFGGFPEEYPSEDTKLNRLKDDNILDFEKDMVSKGTAQIHRSSPDNIYLTLATGSHNPTFMLQHEGEQTWRYSPTRKFVEKLKKLKAALPPQTAENVQVFPEAILDAAKDQKIEKAANILSDVRNPYMGRGILDNTDIKNITHSALQLPGKAIRGLVHGMADNPVTSIAGIYGANRLISKIKDYRNPEREIERQMKTPLERNKEYVNPALAAGMAVLAAKALSVK